jgi:hypothetical protein
MSTSFQNISPLPAPSYSLSSAEGRKRQHTEIWTSAPKKVYLVAKKQKNEIGLEIMKFGTSVEALQEIRWEGQGQINKKDCSLFFSGPKNRTGQLSTGFMINNKMKKQIL